MNYPAAFLAVNRKGVKGSSSGSKTSTKEKVIIFFVGLFVMTLIVGLMSGTVLYFQAEPITKNQVYGYLGIAAFCDFVFSFCMFLMMLFVD